MYIDYLEKSNDNHSGFLAECFVSIKATSQEGSQLENSPAGTSRHRDDDGRTQQTRPTLSLGSANRGANSLPCLCASPLQQRKVQIFFFSLVLVFFQPSFQFVSGVKKIRGSSQNEKFKRRDLEEFHVRRDSRLMDLVLVCFAIIACMLSRGGHGRCDGQQIDGLL